MFNCLNVKNGVFFYAGIVSLIEIKKTSKHLSMTLPLNKVKFRILKNFLL